MLTDTERESFEYQRFARAMGPGPASPNAGQATLRRKPADERTIRVSLYGSGHRHWHVILSKSRGLNRVLAVSTFTERSDAAERARRVRANYERFEYTARELGSGTYLELRKHGASSSYLTVRACDLKHRIDG